MVSMLPVKSVALIGAVCLTTGWLLASIMTPPVARVQTLAERRPASAQPAPDAAPFPPLLLKVHHAPAPPTPRRNPFVFGARHHQTTAAPEPAADQQHVAVPPPPPVAPVGPTFELSGIGVTGDVRTAVLSDGKSVRLARVGDVLSGYQVLEISDSTVTLAGPAGERYMLKLR